MEKRTIKATVRNICSDDLVEKYHNGCVDLTELCKKYAHFMWENSIADEILYQPSVFRNDRTMDDLILEISGDTADMTDHSTWVVNHPGKFEEWVRSWADHMPEDESVGDVLVDMIIDDTTENMYAHFEDFCLLVAVLMCKYDHNLHYLPVVAWNAIRTGVEELVNSGDEFDTNIIRAHIERVL